jgi:hypothetical protein
VIDGIRQLVLPLLRHEARPDRRPYLFSPILFPVANDDHLD